MGKYRLGHIIRMTRKSLLLTQEQLCEDICSVETLSRIENGKQNPSKDIYELLMGRMGRNRERALSLISISGYMILEKIKQFEDYMEIYEFKNAELILNEIKNIIGNTTLDKQFIIMADTIINFRLNRITAKEFLVNLESAILLTIPQYSTISLSGWPLNYNEVELLLNISSAYANDGNYDKAIEVLEGINNIMKLKYMDDQQRSRLQVKVLTNLSKWYGLIGNYEKAIITAEEGVLICKKYKLGNVVPNLIYGIAWNKEQLIEKGILPFDNRKDCIQLLKQSYYIACAMHQPFIEQFILEHIKKIYGNTLI